LRDELCNNIENDEMQIECRFSKILFFSCLPSLKKGRFSNSLYNHPSQLTTRQGVSVSSTSAWSMQALLGHIHPKKDFFL
jgi:hypothetical protein